MSANLHSGNGQAADLKYSSLSDGPVVVLHHSNEVRAEHLSSIIFSVCSNASIVPAGGPAEIGEFLKTTASLIVVTELREDILPLLSRRNDTVRFIVIDESLHPQLKLAARFLVAGAQAAVFHTDVAQLRAILIQLVREMSSASEKKFIEMGARHGLVGTSPVWLKVLRQVDIYSPYCEVPILLYGESGTGKELVARALHSENAQFGRGPFMAVNCATMRGELVRSELFGSRKGSFTGSIENRTGLFEAAQGGTIFLDDIQALDAITQPMLLRALQEKRILPVGSTTEIEIQNVRVIAATNEPLRALIRAGQFRRDLYYRLNVLQIHLPLLRERGDDVVLLAQHFLAKYARVYGSSAEALSPEVLAAFKLLLWPGNVRELENVMIRAVVSGRGKTEVTFGDLGLEVMKTLSGKKTKVSGVSYRPLGDTIKTRVLQALEAAGGHRTNAANILGISVRTLQRKLKAWGMVDET